MSRNLLLILFHYYYYLVSYLFAVRLIGSVSVRTSNLF